MDTELIIIKEYCERSHLEPAFFQMLEEVGLLDIRLIEGEYYIYASQLPVLERYTRMYYDLSINIEGIDAIQHLLNRITALQEEVNSLKSQLRLYED